MTSPEFIINNHKAVNDFRNVILAFQQDESLTQSLAFNTLYDRAVFLRDLPWRQCKDRQNGTEWEDSDTLQFMRYAADTYDVVFQDKSVEQAVQMLTAENRFCPIKQYLNQLKWDGIPRIATAFHDFLGVEINPYTLETSSLFFKAIVARVYRAGCKFDHVIVLQGGQGIGKSSFLRILGGNWYSDSIRKFEGKEAIEALQGVLIGEIPELQGFSKAEVEEIKAFITRTDDRTRPAYGRRTKSYPRRTILVGTTNAEDYLRDYTGNRRFLPIICRKKLDFAHLVEMRDQLFAEAVSRYQSDPISPLILHNPEAQQLAEEAQLSATYSDPWESVILGWLEEKIPIDYWERKPNELIPLNSQWVQRDKVATIELLTECLGLPLEKINNSNRKRVADIMGRIGWEQGNFRYGKRYPKSRGYKRLE